MNYIRFITGEAKEKILGFFVYLLGFSTNKSIGINNKKITPKEKEQSLNKRSTATGRDFETIIDFAAASNNSLDQQTNEDIRIDISSLKYLTDLNERNVDDVMLKKAVYHAPFSHSTSENVNNVRSSELEDLRHELLEEMRDERTNRKVEILLIRHQMAEIRDEMMNQIERAVKKLTEVMQRAEKI